MIVCLCFSLWNQAGVAVINSNENAEVSVTPQEMDAPETMQYKRIFDRVAEMCPVSLLIDGESRRIRNAQRRKEIARELLL